MSRPIRLSEKYGVNPTVCQYFWCGEDTGELALLGRMRGDVEAPHRAFINYEPCSDCQKKWDSGIVLLEVISVSKTTNPPIFKDGIHAFTGCYMVVPEELVKQLLNQDSVVDRVIEKRKGFLPPEVFNVLLKKITEAGLIGENHHG